MVVWGVNPGEEEQRFLRERNEWVRVARGVQGVQVRERNTAVLTVVLNAVLTVVKR